MFAKLFVPQLCALCLVLVSVRAGNVTVQLTLISYSNPTGRDWLNQRCDDGSECDTYLRVCLDKPTGRYKGFTTDLDDCFFYTEMSNRFSGHSPMFTDSNVGFPNPVEVNISDWEGGFQVKAVTYDEDRLNEDDVIDVILYEYEDLPAKSLQEAGAGVTVDVPGKGPGAKTSLKFNLLVYCSEFYYYPTPGDPTDPCSLYCKSEDSSTGHYNCTETGQIICLPGWINEASNCLVSTNRLADINTNTTKDTKDITGPVVDSTAKVIGTEDFFGNHRHLIIGLIGGLFLLLLIIVLLIALLLRNKRKRKQKDQASSAYVNTAVAGQQTATTASNSAGTATYDNPLYLNKANGTPAESPYAEVDYSMVKLPLGEAYGQEAIPAAKAREAGVSTDNYYDINLKYNPKNTQPSPYMQDERSRSKYGMGSKEKGAFGGSSEIGMVDGVRGGFSPMGGDSTMYGFAVNRFDNPTYEAPNLDVDVPGKVSVVKKMAGMYDEPIKFKM